jgi:hypothetical protein
MKLLPAIRCRFAWHHWGPIIGDVGGAHRQCVHCGRVKPADTGQRAEPERGFGGSKGSKWHHI